MKGLTLALASLLLVLATQAVAAGPATSTVYVVGSLTVPGVDTGLVLKKGHSVTATATGAVCPHDPSSCVGPDGDPSFGTQNGPWVLPAAPAWGLVARVGTGPWVQVGSGPTTLAGSGDLVFAMNDQYGAFGDNSGSFTVTVSTTSRGKAPTCYPGWGYGDTNHEHCGPPGLANKPSPGQSGPPGTHGSSDQHGDDQPSTDSQGNGSSNGKGHP
jgi:PA-IL-like protein